jgi:ferrous iron transport protein A
MPADGMAGDVGVREGAGRVQGDWPLLVMPPAFGRRQSLEIEHQIQPIYGRTVTLAHARPGERLIVDRVGGDRAFRRRLMELGFVPGTPVELVGVAPLGDPIELLMRGCSLSIRRGEALWVTVHRAGAAPAGGCDAPAPPVAEATPCTACGRR